MVEAVERVPRRPAILYHGRMAWEVAGHGDRADPAERPHTSRKEAQR